MPVTHRGDGASYEAIEGLRHGHARAQADRDRGDARLHRFSMRCSRWPLAEGRITQAPKLLQTVAYIVLGLIWVVADHAAHPVDGEARQILAVYLCGRITGCPPSKEKARRKRAFPKLAADPAAAMLPAPSGNPFAVALGGATLHIDLADGAL